jgi:hypothetical protein
MDIHNVVEIYDNGEFVTIVTSTGSSVHLPIGMKHSISIKMPDEDGNPTLPFVIVSVDINQG